MGNRQTRIPSRLFVTGTDTGIGKTVICAILMAGLRGIYWKPIQSGQEGITDTQWVRDRTGLPAEHFHPETYRLRLPLSPHASAAHDGVRIELESFTAPETGEFKKLIIEGAGGLMVPLNERHFMTDLIRKLDAPALLVSSSSLGTINHTLLSLDRLRREGLDITGVVMNGPRNPVNRKAIEDYGGIKVLAEIEFLPVIDPETLVRCFEENFRESG
jgi:dethiobiotin synthetase